MIQTTITLPIPTRCPNPACGYIDRTTICRFCGTDKTSKRQVADEETNYDTE